MTTNYHAMNQKEMSKGEILQSYTTGDKTIAYYKPVLFGKTQYFVCVHRKDTDKKTKETKEYYEPIFRTENLDSAVFVWNNVYMFDLSKRPKTYINHIMTLSELDAKIKAEKKGVKDKEIKVNIVNSEVENCNEFVGFETKKPYVPMGNRLETLDKVTQLLMEFYC